MKSYGSIGDFGDIIFSLPCVKLNGKGVYYGVDKPDCRPITPRLHLLRRLLYSQDYIVSLKPHRGEKIDYDFCSFRDNGMPYGVTLAELHAKYVGLDPDLSSPWLKVEPSPESKGKIVVARSARYRNKRFPWKSIVEQYSRNIVFVGLPEEYQNFADNFGPVDYLPTKDLYEVATLIAGSELFIGNQSSPNAICEGLKHPSVLEVSLEAPDCIYPRDNAKYCYDGSVSFEVLGSKFESPSALSIADIDLQSSPPGGWIIEIDGKKERSYSPDILMDKLRHVYRLTRTQALDRFLETVEIPMPEKIANVEQLITSKREKVSQVLAYE